MDDEEEEFGEYEVGDPGLRPVQLSWRLPVGAFLECISQVIGAFAGLFSNLSCAVLAHQLHVEQQTNNHAQAALELETLIKGD